jgi:hypothetical protein
VALREAGRRAGTGTTPGAVPSHFPGFDVLTQADHWDDETRAVVLARTQAPGPLRFFTPHEARVAGALVDQLLDQRTEPRIPVLHMIDARLADHETDGWHYDGMPTDDVAWQRSLAGLDADARTNRGHGFAECTWHEQSRLVIGVQERGDAEWRGMLAERVWSLWTRYACTAFYSHPWSWNEIGFGGPAYPRGYKNARVGGREPWEVAERRPVDPVLRTT